MRNLILALALSAGLAAPAAARSLPDGGVTADEVARELIAKGFKAQISRDGAGDPKITSGVDGSTFTIWFYDCKSGRCASVQFQAGFNLEKGLPSAKINEWNSDRRFGRGLLDDENDPYIRYDIDFEHGATSEAVANVIDLWEVMLPEFKEFIGF